MLTRQSTESIKYFRRLLRISYIEPTTNEYLRQPVDSLVGKQEPLLASLKRRKRSWFCDITRHNTISKTTLQGNLDGERTTGWTTYRTKRRRQTLLHTAEDTKLAKTICGCDTYVTVEAHVSTHCWFIH